MQNSIVESYTAWLNSYIKNKDNMYRSVAQKMLSHLKKDISLDELIDLVKKAQVQKGVFLSDDPLIIKLQELEVNLSKRKEMAKVIDNKEFLAYRVPGQAQPLLNLIKQLLSDPKFLLHQRALLVFSNLQDPASFEKILSYIVAQPIVAEIVSDLESNSFSDEIDEDYVACRALLKNHSCTFDEKNKLGLAANSLLVNTTAIYEDLQVPLTNSNSKNCILI
jgi:hypothetical protein